MRRVLLMEKGVSDIFFVTIFYGMEGRIFRKLKEFWGRVLNLAREA